MAREHAKERVVLFYREIFILIFKEKLKLLKNSPFSKSIKRLPECVYEINSSLFFKALPSLER